MRKLLLLVGLVFLAAPAWAQGVRRDGVAIVQIGENLRPVPGGRVGVCSEPSAGAACNATPTLYANEALTLPIQNPVPTNPNGTYTYFAAPGYYTETISGSGVIPQTLPDVLLTLGTGAGSNLVPQTVTAANYIPTSTATNTVAWEQINGGASCGDSSHAVSFNATTHLFSCQTISGSGTPGLPSASIQFNAGLAVFGGDSNLTWDNTAKQLIDTGSAVFSSIASNLIPDVVNTRNLGSVLLPWMALKIGPAANESISLQGTNLTGNRTWEAADASGTVAPVTGSPSNNDCAKITVSGGLITGITSAGTGACGASSGTVSSVAESFTGGVISVAGSPITTSGTFALTVAGTSGGIPYFASANTWASSAALTANLPVIGGGAGTAPSVGTVSGNTTEFGTVSGTLTSGHLIKSDASGNLIDSGAAATSGTVTSAAESFTGGLISVAGSPITTSGTFALTVAGTSGGVPYFSSSSTWASSGALTANLPVIGGGAGSAPTVGTVSGNTTKFVTTTGALTNGHCVSIDANSNFVDSGTSGPCGAGAGGAVTSVAFTAPTGFGVSGSPITTSGTIALTMPSSWANGSLLYGTGASTVATLVAGTNGQVLEMVAGIPAWAAGPSATPALSALSAATGTNTINNLNNAQTWEWTKTSNTTSAFQLTEAAASTCTTCFLVNINTLSTSTITPFQVTVGGTTNGITVNASTGTLSAMGTANINATQYKGVTASGVGSACTANQFVNQLRDALGPLCAQPSFSNLSGTIALAQTVLTTAGDILYVNASPALARLPKSTDGFVLTLVSGLPAWAAAGGGTVGITGTPAVNSLAQWTSSTTIQGLVTVGGGTNPLMVVQTGPVQGQYWGLNASLNTVNLTPGLTEDKRACNDYTILQADAGKVIYCTDAGAAAVTLQAPGVYSAGFYFRIMAQGAGTVTVTATGNIGGNATLAIVTKNNALITTDASTWDYMGSVGF